MKQTLFILCFMLGFTAIKSQETKNLIYDTKAEKRDVESFNAIEVGSAITLYISQGNTTGVAVSVDGDSNDKLKTEVRNGTLKIFVSNGFWNKWNWGNSVKLKAYVTIKDLAKLNVSGASRTILTDKISVTDLKVTLSGASSLKGDIAASNLLLDLSGASTATIGGNTHNLDVRASGASNLKAYALESSSCSAEASGASDIKITVLKEFNKIEASGASSIRYKGEAIIKNFESSGASSIKKDSK
ncbi:MAG: DUF2807 domain-containing protein [Sphingobacteriia bacterium]|nr:DUF2807 domain-containing protein [Sphingobacteriia bacterium]